jgi:hypothetical protein
MLAFTLVVALGVVAGSSAAGRVGVNGDGTRGTATFSFSVVLKAGAVSGPFSFDNGLGTSYSGNATCGSVSGNIAIFGGTATDNSGRTTDAVFEVSDNPDGLIFGTGRPACDTTGFGDPTSLPITSGSIRITGRR